MNPGEPSRHTGLVLSAEYNRCSRHEPLVLVSLSKCSVIGSSDVRATAISDSMMKRHEQLPAS